MTRCLDIHTHHPAPQPLGVISASISDFNPVEGQLYSIGIHPWETKEEISALQWEKLEKMASLPCVVAIGECGIDKIKGGFMFRQVGAMDKQVDISEKLGKPLIIHDVKAHDIIVGLKKDKQPKQKWLVHGLRAKPTVAQMLVKEGIYLSYGFNYNPESLLQTPQDMILAETDEAPENIEQIIENLSATLGFDATNMILENTSNFLYNNIQPD